jgi:hypothetical protein
VNVKAPDDPLVTNQQLIIEDVDENNAFDLDNLDLDNQQQGQGDGGGDWSL